MIASEVKEKRFSAPMHYHPELELTLILEGSGQRFVGDSIQNFGPGDLVLIGENTPHFWRSDLNTTNNCDAHAIVVQFDKSFPGENFFKNNSGGHIDRIINISTRGLHLSDPYAGEQIKEKLMQILAQSPFEKTLTLLEILNIFGKANITYLASSGFRSNLNEIDMNRMNKVYSYVYNNINSSFDVSTVAGLVNMSMSAFCHYFKKRTQKTFVQFINETRISNAKRLLMETDKSVAEIAYESGYNSLSNFNKQFLFLEGISPKTFRQRFLV